MTLLQRLIELTEKEAIPFLKHQNRVPDTRDYGGYIPPDRGYCEPVHSALAANLLTALRISGTRIASDGSLEERILLYLDHLETRQHDDGTIDLIETNYHDPTALAFTLQYSADTLRLLYDRKDSFAQQGYPCLSRYILKGIPALAHSGFHTPNHRWVVTSAIAQVTALIREGILQTDQSVLPALEAEMGRYLSEGIDMDRFGEYTEKSTGIYNVACNDSLLIIAHRIGSPGLLDYVRRNLDLLPKYVEPDDSLFTMTSTRQDSGKRMYPHHYFANFLEYGTLANAPEYRALGMDLLIHRPDDMRHDSRSFLSRVLCFPDLLQSPPPTASLPDKSDYFNPELGLLRRRFGETAVSAVSGTTRFLKWQKKSLWVILRWSASFFGEKGRFIPETIEQHGVAALRMRYACEWGYRRPFDTPPASPEWHAMDHGRRARVYMQHLRMTADIMIAAEGLTVDFDIAGPEGLLYKIDLIVPAGGRLTAAGAKAAPVSDTAPGTAGTGRLCNDTIMRYDLGDESLTVEGAFAEHGAGAELRGAEAQDAQAFTLWMTGFAPDRRRIVIR